jgi:prepilin-type N-terminal cleavage/methylation domain-containing protein
MRSKEFVMFGKYRNGRRGFTLVELLVTITIIASLMGLTSVAIYKVMKRAKQTVWQVEIDQLAQAITGYKEKHIGYPPCMGVMPGLAGAPREKLFDRHLKQAFPSSSFTYTTASGAITNTYHYNYVAGGTVYTLSLGTLDAAESMVFWLGGLPTPVNTANNNAPLAANKLFGFNRDATNPFKIDAGSYTLTADAMRFRTFSTSFQFDQTRLVDNDQDGWLEYIPTKPAIGDVTAPYVYFDSNSYGNLTTGSAVTLFPKYPNPATAGANDPALTLLGRWGAAVPLALTLGSNAAGVMPIQWANPNGVQIICAGADGQYAGNGSVSLTVVRVPTFPNQANVLRMASQQAYEVYATSGGPFTSPPTFPNPNFTDWELDNQTNLSGKTLEDARTEALR